MASRVCVRERQSVSVVNQTERAWLCVHAYCFASRVISNGSSVRTGAGEKTSKVQIQEVGGNQEPFFFCKVILWQVTDTPNCTSTATRAKNKLSQLKCVKNLIKFSEMSLLH